MTDSSICYYAYKMEIDDEEVTFVKGFPSNVSADTFFTEVAKKICFSDCEPLEIVEIKWYGRNVYYDGWRRGMYFGFSNMNGKCVWGGAFPEWDH